MEGLEAFLANRVLWAALLSWFSAQSIKFVLTYMMLHKFDFQRMFGSGGMPSAHSAFICALTTGILISRGAQSAEFAICVGLALIVMYDAAGVRRSAGRQAAVINQIVNDMSKRGNKLITENLKELLGHTPFEVIVGALLGILIAVLYV